ncbi:MAG: PepSY domain-containing protein [Granulosicoccus sp.]
MSAQNCIRLPGLILLVMLVLSLVSNTAYAIDAANREQAIEIALQQSGATGKVLGVKTVKNKDGQTVYAVKVLSEGRVRVIRVKQRR